MLELRVWEEGELGLGEVSDLGWLMLRVFYWGHNRRHCHFSWHGRWPLPCLHTGNIGQHVCVNPSGPGRCYIFGGDHESADHFSTCLWILNPEQIPINPDVRGIVRLGVSH